MEQELVSLIGTLGFPIIVCLWFMIRTEKVINNNTKMLEKVLEKL